jgi:hypothetical protein
VDVGGNLSPVVLSDPGEVNPYREAGERDEGAVDVAATRARYRRASLERRLYALAVVVGALAGVVAIGSQSVLRDFDAEPAEACVEDTSALFSLHMRLDSLDEPWPMPARACKPHSVGVVRLP